MIAIIDYDMGNLRSLENALDRLGATYCVTADPDTIRKADKVILPGVGHAGLAMDNLVERGLPAVIRSLRQPVLCKVPHMGWNDLGNLEGKLFKDMKSGAYVYFVHSYFAGLCPDTVATCKYAGVMFSAALRYENFYGTQFHPEKSGSVGEKILQNFLAL